jgi:hypothetical protein
MIANLNAWVGKTQAEKAKVKAKAGEYVRSKVRQVLREALIVSPQWSGNYAANWVIETNKTGKGSYTSKFKVDPWTKLIDSNKPYGTEKSAGHLEAIKWNLKYINDEIIEQIKYNSIIRLNNYSPVAEDIEQGNIQLREPNRASLPGGTGVLAHLSAKFKFVKLA